MCRAEDMVEAARSHFPEAVNNGTLPLDGAQPTCEALVDSSDTEELLGHVLLGVEEQAKSMIAQLLAMKGVAAA